jgi:hypothetical protein
VLFIRSRGCYDLRPVEIGYFKFPDTKGNTHYQFASSLVFRHSLHHLFTLSTSRMVQRSRTNLIVGDDLSQILEKPEYILTVLNVICEPLQLWPLAQQPQLSLDVFELAGGNSMPSLRRGTMAYSINSCRRLCSSTSSGRVPKRASSAAIRERRSSILFSRRRFPVDGLVKNNFEQGKVNELRVLHRRRRWLLGWFGEDRTHLRLPLCHQQEWGQSQAPCLPNLSSELVDVNGKVMTQWGRHVPLVTTVGLPSSSLVPSAFPPEVGKYRSNEHRSR